MRAHREGFDVRRPARGVAVLLTIAVAAALSASWGVPAVLARDFVPVREEAGGLAFSGGDHDGCRESDDEDDDSDGDSDDGHDGSGHDSGDRAADHDGHDEGDHDDDDDGDHHDDADNDDDDDDESDCESEPENIPPPSGRSSPPQSESPVKNGSSLPTASLDPSRRPASVLGATALPQTGGEAPSPSSGAAPLAQLVTGLALAGAGTWAVAQAGLKRTR